MQRSVPGINMRTVRLTRLLFVYDWDGKPVVILTKEKNGHYAFFEQKMSVSDSDFSAAYVKLSKVLDEESFRELHKNLVSVNNVHLIDIERRLNKKIYYVLSEISERQKKHILLGNKINRSVAFDEVDFNNVGLRGEPGIKNGLWKEDLIILNSWIFYKSQQNPSLIFFV